MQSRRQLAEALCNHHFRCEGRSDVNGNRGKMRDATAEAQECEWKRLRLTWASVRGVSAYLVLRRSTQQGGLSTPFGWRLTPPQDDRELELGRVDSFQKRIAFGGPMQAIPKYRFPLRGGNACLLLRRSTQQGGLSTPFGWRLTALKMTEN